MRCGTWRSTSVARRSRRRPRKPKGGSEASPARSRLLDSGVYYIYNTLVRRIGMFENPVAKRTAVAAAIGAVIAIPLPFVGPIIGALVGGGIGYFTARTRRRA